ncbi:MAG TPA: hypothetical protein VHB68_13125 [Steroidobacteraceae bacterium]|nr:hypothetical protein [Steroidobacteraceae bacterium]
MVSDLLLDVYACPTDRGRWSRVLDTLRGELRVRCAALQCFEQDGSAFKVKWLARDSAAEADEAHHDPYVSGDDNPRVHSTLLDPRIHGTLLPCGMFVRDSDLFEPGNPEASRLHERLGDMGLGLFLSAWASVGPGSRLVLALHRDINDPRDFGREEEAYLAVLMPHLQQAVLLANRLDAERDMRSDLQTAVDHLQCGLLLFTPDARPGWMNAAARRILSRRTAQDTSALRRIIAAARQHQCLVLGDLQILVVPLADKVLVMLSERGASPALPPELIARLFTLTPTESRLTAALCQGATVTDYARTHQVSVGTARFQLKQILAKTRTARQSDLVREVCTSVVAHALKPHTSSCRP